MEAIVEISAGSSYKYEMKDNQLVLDRVLNQHVPFNYGFFPDTLCGDGDPLDVFIISKYPIPSGTKVKVSIIGGFKCVDNHQQDDKLIGVLEGEEYYFTNRQEACISEIRHYLQSYKEGFHIDENMDLKKSFHTYECTKYV